MNKSDALECCSMALYGRTWPHCSSNDQIVTTSVCSPAFDITGISQLIYFLTHSHTYTNTHTCMWATHLHTRTKSHTYTCMHAHTHTHTHTMLLDVLVIVKLILHVNCITFASCCEIKSYLKFMFPYSV